MKILLATDKRQVSRRRHLRGFVYPERRTGFDRCVAGQTGVVRFLAYLANHQSIFFKMLIAINTLSVLDFLLTLNLMNGGFVLEGNPVIAVLMRLSPLAALAFKASLVLLVSSIFWKFRRYRMTLAAAACTLAVYTLLVSYQLALHTVLL